MFASGQPDLPGGGDGLSTRRGIAIREAAPPGESAAWQSFGVKLPVGNVTGRIGHLSGADDIRQQMLCAFGQILPDWAHRSAMCRARPPPQRLGRASEHHLVCVNLVNLGRVGAEYAPQAFELKRRQPAPHPLLRTFENVYHRCSTAASYTRICPRWATIVAPIHRHGLRCT